jgi:hypothetical protein
MTVIENGVFNKRRVSGLSATSQSVPGTLYADVTPPLIGGVEAGYKI